MADEESQVQEETSWWALEAFADSELPSMSIDEPLVWPDSLPWEEFSAGAAPVSPAYTSPPPDDLIFPAHAPAAPVPAPPEPSDLEWQPDGYDRDATMAATPLAGLGGGAPAPATRRAHDGNALHPVPETIWDASGKRDDQVAGLAALAGPLVYADTDGRGRGRWPRRLDIRRGNVAIVALISAVSLVLLGMFLSVRSRNDVPTDATGSPPRTDQIATAGTRNSIPATTAVVSTTVPAPVINIADLLPPADAGTAGSAGGGGATSSATTAPTRSTAAPTGGGGGSTATTQPAPLSTATTAAPEPPPDTTPAPPPADDTTDTTSRRTSTSISLPSIPNISIPTTGSTLPNGFPNFPSFTNRPND